MILDWIEWALIVAALLSQAAIALVVAAISVSVIRARRADNPAKQLHRMGVRLTSSRDRAHARIGFLLIDHAHSLEPKGCRCPISSAKET